jgi:acyl-CoA synthetase (NDP forming)
VTKPRVVAPEYSDIRETTATSLGIPTKIGYILLLFGASHVDNRSIQVLKPLLNPDAIAVVGASEKFGAGSLVIENLRTLGYEGKIIPVNPGYSTVLGLPCYPSLLEVPSEQKIDCVAIVLGYRQVIPVLEQAAQRGVRAAWAFASGFAETGEEGARLQDQLRALCLARRILFCGPNCVGCVNLHGRVGTFSAPISPTLRKGRIGAVAQSGSVILALANSNRGVGFSTLVSSGNEAVLDTTDYLDYFLEDENTAVVIAFLEGIRRPEAFIQACERAAQLKKPIIVVKVGRSELAQKTAVTHTGALTGSDEVHDAVFRRLGVIRVDALDELLETAEAFVHCGKRLPQGDRVGVITVSGGEIGLIGDLAKRFSFSFPPLSPVAREELERRLPPFTPIDNPLDAWGSGDLRETYPACLEVLAKEQGIDLIAVSQDAPPGMAEKQMSQYADVARAAVRASSSGKPVVVFSHVSGGLDPTIKDILDRGHVPFLQGTRESLFAVHNLIEYGRFQRRRALKHEVSGDSPANLAVMIERLGGARRVLGYDESREILRAFKIPMVGEVLAKSMEHALEAAETIGYPVVLKGQSPQIPHKTDAGLVWLNVGDQTELRTAYEAITRRVHEYDATAALEGILVQDMVPLEAVEVIVGVSRDGSFGPVVVLGLGGILVELLKDTSLRLPPISLDEAYTMIAELRGRPLLEGFRGKGPADIDALASVLVQVGRMALDMREVLVSLDLNPLMILPREEGVRVVDVVMEVGDRKTNENQKTSRHERDPFTRRRRERSSS